MGQAKQRGTYEERKLEAQMREAHQMEERRKVIEARKAERRAHEARQPSRSAQRRTGGLSSRTLMMAAAMTAISMSSIARHDKGGEDA